MGKQLIDYTGRRFGRLVVIGRAPNYLSPGDSVMTTRWTCVCDCGKTVVALKNNLKSGRTKSCGCLRRENKFGREEAAL